MPSRLSSIAALTLLVGVSCWSQSDEARTSRELSSAHLPELQMLVVLDRNKIEAGETVVLTLVLPPDTALAGSPVMSEALDVTELPHDRPELMRYRIKTAKAGEYSIVIRGAHRSGTEASASYINKTVLLTVAAKKNSLAGISGVVIGTFLGLASSFMGLCFKEWTEGRSTERKGILWLSNELVGRLEAARLDLKNGRTVNYQPWVDELYAKYFSTLRKWESTSEAGERLSQEVIEIAGMLGDYNKSLNKIAADDSLVAALDERIVGVQRRLSR